MDEIGSSRIKKRKNGSMIRVSLLFLEVLEKQKERVRKVTYNSVQPSDTEITDILAKKLINKGLV